MLGVSLHPGQQRILSEVFPKGAEPLTDWSYKFIHMATGNRFGKSALFAVTHLWFAAYKHRSDFKIGTPEWLDLQYAVLNLGPQNENAYVVREKVGLILQDRADEQVRRRPTRGHIRPEFQALFRQAKPGEVDKSGNPFLLMIPDTEYKGYITEHNSFLEFRTTDDHVKALQGRKKFLVTFDEAAREKDPVTMIASDIAPRTIDTRGILFTASTPHLETGGNYEAVWETGNPTNPDRAKYTISFTGSMRENPYITEQMIEESLSGQPDYLHDQIINGKFVQSEEAFFNAESIKRSAKDVEAQPRRTKGHSYIIGCDLAIAKDGDRSIFVVWDISKLPHEVVDYREHRGRKGSALIREMREMLEFYNNERFECSALLVYDRTGMGGQLIGEELSMLRPRPRGFEFAGSKHKKISILMTLKTFLDKGLLAWPKEYDRITYELRRYRLKDQKLETDAVMSMAMAAYYAERIGRPSRVNRPLIGTSIVY